jgi:rare lipoprotein A (peptidoglycan hydrolase)
MIAARFVRGRLIDLSGASAEALDFHRAGVTRVRVRYLGRAAPRV